MVIREKEIETQRIEKEKAEKQRLEQERNEEERREKDRQEEKMKNEAEGKIARTKSNGKEQIKGTQEQPQVARKEDSHCDQYYGLNFRDRFTTGYK